jgi:hypothetical protein
MDCYPSQGIKVLISEYAKPWISADQISNASMPEQVKRSNPWRRKMMMLIIKFAEVFISLIQNVFVLL